MTKGINGNKVRTIECVSCGKSVTKRMPEGRKFCSLECYRTSERPDRRRGEDRPCELCGTVVYVKSTQIKKASNFFCSPEHANEWQGRNKDRYTCKTCGDIFTRSPSNKKHTVPTYCSIACRDADPSRREMLIKMNVDQITDKFNKLEISGYEMLDEIDAPYQKQVLLFGKFCVDAFFPAHRLVVQFDGDYWHGHPTKFPVPDSRQLRRMQTDRSQDAYFAKAGYMVVRLWESDIKKNRTDAVDSVREAIHAVTLPIAA